MSDALERPHTSYRAVAGALLAAGVLLRVWEFAARRSLWNDETTIALNITSRSFGELLAPLDLGQAAPPLFLLATKAATEAFGVNEWALRLPSLVSGVLLLLLLAPLARRLLPSSAAVLALALVALSPGLVYYSNEVKPYGSDALLACALLLAVLRARDHASGRRTLAVALAGAIAVWASYPAAFVLAAIGLVMVVRDWRTSAPARLATFAMAVTWLASFATAYVTTYRDVAGDAYMRRFWAGSFLFGHPDPVSRLAEVVGGPMSGTFLDRDLFVHLPEVVRLGVVGSALACFVVGMVALQRRQGTERALFVVGPMIVVAATYLVGQYPLALRMVLFAAPMTALLVAGGLHGLTARRDPRLFVLLAVALLIPAAYHAVLQLRDPLRRLEQPRPVILSLAEHLEREPEPVWLAPGAAPVWVFYTTDWSSPDTARIRHLMRHARPPDGLAFPNHAPRVGPPDVRDGVELVFRGGPFPLLLATYAGQEYRMALPEREGPDPGWVDAEAQRISDVAARCAWLFHSAGLRSSTIDVPGALGRLGFRQVDQFRGRRAGARRMCRSAPAQLDSAASR